MGVHPPPLLIRADFQKFLSKTWRSGEIGSKAVAASDVQRSADP
jgi:hypothetical protein